MAGRPFALIGVNSDPELEKAQAAVKKNELNWRSFQNERQDLAAISEDWAVQGWPTVIVMDAKQNIMYRGHDGHEATKIAQQLVVQLEKHAAEKELVKIGTHVGSTAADIVGLDLDGESFSLYAFKGQVLMLDFWGDW
jgi:hypothetical protein